MFLQDGTLQRDFAIAMIVVFSGLFLILRSLYAIEDRLRNISMHLQTVKSIDESLNGIRLWHLDIVTEIRRLSARIDIDGEHDT